MMIGRRVLQCLVPVAGAFLSISAMAASPVGGAGAMGYSCNKVNDASGRWFCKCSGVEVRSDEGEGVRRRPADLRVDRMHLHAGAQGSSGKGAANGILRPRSARTGCDVTCDVAIAR